MSLHRYEFDEPRPVIVAQIHQVVYAIVQCIIAYCRVSSQAQKPDLLNQQAILRDYCKQHGIQVDEWISEIGGGLNFERKQFLKLVDAIVAGEVACVVLAHQDRLVRFGYTLLAHLCQTHQCKMVVMNTETLSPEQEMVQDLMTIINEIKNEHIRLQVKEWVCTNI